MCVYTTWKPQTQQHYITSAFELPTLSVTSEEHHVSTVSGDFVWIHVPYIYSWKGTVPSDLTGICAQATLVKQAGDDPRGMRKTTKYKQVIDTSARNTSSDYFWSGANDLAPSGWRVWVGILLGWWGDGQQVGRVQQVCKSSREPGAWRAREGLPRPHYRETDRQTDRQTERDKQETCWVRGRHEETQNAENVKYLSSG